MKTLTMLAVLFFTVRISYDALGWKWVAFKDADTDQPTSIGSCLRFTTQEKAQENWEKYASFFGLNAEDWSFAFPQESEPQ